MAHKPYRVSTSKLFRTSFALDHKWLDMSVQLRNSHAAGSQTDYIKGLIALDWLRTKREPLDLKDIPAWAVIADKLEVIGGKVQPPK